jgi:nicotinamidase/pyrazinamidase
MKTINLNHVAVISVDNTKTFEDASYKELYVQEGEQAAQATKKLIDLLQPYGALIVNVFEQHPRGHISFADNYLDKKPFDMIAYEEVKDWTEENHRLAPEAEFTVEELQSFLKEVGSQMLWPQHSKDRTDSAELMEPLKKDDFAITVIKGTNPAKEAYSGFDETDLNKKLKENQIQKVVLWWVATDYCVGKTALDAADKWYEVIVVDDAVRGVAPESTQAMIASFTQNNIRYVTLKELENILFA